MERAASFSFFFFFFFVLSCPSILMLVAASEDATSPSVACNVKIAPTGSYIIYVNGPSNGEDLETYSINILVSVLGSEEAAKKALTHLYKYVMTGFSAKLDPKQACGIARAPGVLGVIPDRYYYIDSPPHRHGKRQL